jgi:aldehyde dehydrogenase (NAD+)
MHFGLFIGGEWRESAAGGTFAAIDPSTGRAVASVARATPVDVDDAVASAERAASEWRAVSPADRAVALHRLADVLIEELDDLARLETLDAGGSLVMSEWTVRDIAARRFRYFAGVADKLEGSTQPLAGGRHAYTVLEPLGVTAHIIPWNGPMWEASRSVAPALAAGNAVVLKPAEEALLGAIRLGELAQRAGLPDGLVNVVPGPGPEVGGYLVEHPGVRSVSFTGSVDTGRDVMCRASRTVKRVVLELGGNAANIVLPDADLDEAVAGSVQGGYANAGQICVAGRRILVHESVASEFTERFVEGVRRLTVGRGMDNPDVGPVAFEEHMHRILAAVVDGERQGARLLQGGRRMTGDAFADGYFIEPTVFDHVDNRMRIAQHEVFGPVVTITTFGSLDEAIALANDTPYGLASGVWTNDLGAAHEVAARLEVGQVYVNEWFCGGIECPAGGYKSSGIGREDGLQAVHNYLQVKSVRMRYRS